MSKEETVAIFVTLNSYEGINESMKCLVGEIAEVQKLDDFFATVSVKGVSNLWPMKAINWGDAK